MKVVTVPGTMQAVYQFWGLYRPEVKGSPLNDVRVREALSLAIDRQQIIDHVMLGEARMPLPFTVYRYSIDVTIPRWRTGRRPRCATTCRGPGSCWPRPATPAASA